MKIYIDVSNLMQVNFISGIQRVVREVVLRMLKEPDLELVLLWFDERERDFFLLSNAAFQAYFQDGKGSREDVKTGCRQPIDTFLPGDVFFEIDSVWHSRLKRMELYPQMKNRGVKIAVCFQDIIPVMWPQYADRRTVATFTGYITACITHADLFISSTHANIQYLHELMEQTGVQNPAPCYVSWLGVDFRTDIRGKIRKSIREAAGDGKYILMVGTVEPRKNHKLILDAFEHKLFKAGLKLVLAGKVGWNVSGLEQRLKNHPKLNKELVWIEDATDAEIEYLYQNSFLVAFPSFTEGFGLPIVEALGRDIPVIAADHPVMREVGGDWCEYVCPDEEEAFVTCVEKYQKNENLYWEWKQRLKAYKPCSWDVVEKNMAEALQRLQYPEGGVQAHIRQMVILSARAEDLLRSLPFVEHFMPFIEEMVLCCPDGMQEEMEKRYQGRLTIRYLTDSMVLGGEALPQDHAARNIFLRAKALKHDIIDDAFLMSDDDYRPLREITPDFFLSEGRYNAYYMNDLCKWHGAQGGLTSFDVSMIKCRDFLTKQGYPTYMFDAHMPQVIDKRIFLEMLDKYPEIMYHGAASEWSGYFNYLAGEYPGLVRIKPYTTLGWPGHLEDWDTEVSCPDFLFENFYDDVYEEKEVYDHPGHFLGFSKEFHEGIEEENQEKTEKMRQEYAEHEKALKKYGEWQSDYRKKHQIEPVFAVYTKDKDICIAVPEACTLQAGSFLRITFAVMLKDIEKTNEEWQMTWGIYEGERLVSSMGSARFLTGEEFFEALLIVPKKQGDYRLEWNLFTGRKRVHHTMRLDVEE